MTTIVAICGSPRKGGNTELALREVLRSATQGGAEEDLIRLADFTVRPCDGCNSCAATGKCHIEDDFERIFRRTTQADGLVFGSLVYNVSMSA